MLIKEMSCLNYVRKQDLGQHSNRLQALFIGYDPARQTAPIMTPLHHTPNPLAFVLGERHLYAIVIMTVLPCVLDHHLVFFPNKLCLEDMCLAASAH